VDHNGVDIILGVDAFGAAKFCPKVAVMDGERFGKWEN